MCAAGCLISIPCESSVLYAALCAVCCMLCCAVFYAVLCVVCCVLLAVFYVVCCMLCVACCVLLAVLCCVLCCVMWCIWADCCCCNPNLLVKYYLPRIRSVSTFNDRYCTMYHVQSHAKNSAYPIFLYVHVLYVASSRMQTSSGHKVRTYTTHTCLLCHHNNF